MIAIKKITDQEELLFKEFVKTERKELPELKLAHLASPHTDILVANFDIGSAVNSIVSDTEYRVSSFGKFQIVSCNDLIQKGNNAYLFSGYCFYDGEMLIGQQEVFNRIYSSDINSLYGEYALCKISENSVELSSDFFGMQAWFYYVDEHNNFAASNNYHLLLKIVAGCTKNIQLDIKHCRVNIITSGFTYGTPFSRKLDVKNFFMNMATEKIFYSNLEGLKLINTELWDILHKNEKWDDQKYKGYIYKAVEELYSCCLAAFKKECFEKVVIDVSGGFDSRVVFATANNLPNLYKEKLYTHTRKSGTKDDVEKASILTNIFNYKKHA